MLLKSESVSTMKFLYIFALVLAFYSPTVSGYGRSKDGKCPPLTGNENCAFRFLNSEFENNPCSATGQDFECSDDEKCCDDGCGGYECKPAIGLPPLPIIEPHCISSKIRVGDQCEPANITYCLANQCNKCCIHNSVCNPTSEYISKDECEKKLCKGIICPGQGEICTLDKYHRAVCECPTECPPDTPNSPVCGSDGVTYENECEMNMTACVTGDWIDVVHQGSCLPPTPKSPLEICSQPKQMGYGWTYELKYYFNKQNGICEGFLYYGKGGNDNNFEKFKDCEDFCSGTIADVCALPKVVGPCRAAFPRWHFNNKVKRCEPFTFGGCSGNKNNFRSKKECNNQCVCSLPKVEGLCLGYFPSWFYNSTSGQCENFVYGGCGGNTNRFHTKNRCLATCEGLSVDPIDVGPKAQCQDKTKFNCRSIKKCLPAGLKCDGVDDCGDNSDEEGCEDPCANKTCNFYSECVKTKNNTALCECPTVCGEIWAPICASDNQTYPNECEMRVESCRKQQHIEIVTQRECEDPCANKTCSFYSECVKTKNNTALCDCPTVCAEIWAPICASDNQTYPNECEMKVQSCKKQQHIEIVTQRECGARAPTKCELARDEKLQMVIVGTYIPQCEDDGSYSAVQCHGSTGYCWCVDGEGNKLVETEIRFDRPNCTKVEARPKSKCEKQRDAVTNGSLLVGAFTPKCEDDGSYSAVQCHSSTGYCWCVDGEGNKLVETEIRFDRPNCTKELLPPTDPPIDMCNISQCEFGKCVNVNGTAMCVCNEACPFIEQPVCGSDNKTYPNLCVMDAQACERKERIKAKHDGPCDKKSKCQKELESALANPMPGSNTPSCDEDGSYSAKQCHGSSGYCWCVTREGVVIPDTHLRFEQPNCTRAPLDPCGDVKCDFYATCVPLVNGEHICDCPRICPANYSPVCASNNVTYDNECQMKVASCQITEMLFVQSPGQCGDPPIDICDTSLCDFGKCVNVNGTTMCICNEACPFIEQPVCGSDNKTYSNLCVMEAEACERKENVTVKHDGPCENAEKLCAAARCNVSQECEVINGSAQCICEKGCTKEYDPICGSDNVTYGNLCELRRASCEEMREIKIVKYGECDIPTIAPVTASAPKALPKCEKCPKSGKEYLIKSYCNKDIKFAIVGEILNVTNRIKGKSEIEVKVDKKFKPTAEKTKFKPNNTVKIEVRKSPDCRCENVEFKANEKYVLMGRKTKSKVFVIKWKTGFVEKVSKPLVDKLDKRSKEWWFCAKKYGG